MSLLRLEPVSYKGALPPSKSSNTTAFDFQQCVVTPDFFSATVSDQAIGWTDCARIAAFAAGAFVVVYLGAQVLRLVNRIDAWLKGLVVVLVVSVVGDLIGVWMGGFLEGGDFLMEADLFVEGDGFCRLQLEAVDYVADFGVEVEEAEGSDFFFF